MAVYYNDADPTACAWLRELIAMGLLPAGEVDERSILEVEPADLRGFTQCHFFAGVGGWAYPRRTPEAHAKGLALTAMGSQTPRPERGRRPRNKERETHGAPEWRADTLTREGSLPQGRDPAELGLGERENARVEPDRRPRRAGQPSIPRSDFLFPPRSQAQRAIFCAATKQTTPIHFLSPQQQVHELA